ncbi:MAG: 50S ribosomal protein L6 [Gammaproteobacteria bacterium]
MSRIARNPVVAPKGVDVTISGQAIKVKGPKGELSYTAHLAVEMVCDKEGAPEGAQLIKFKPRDGSKPARANAGTTRALVNNMVIGVSEGFELTLELVGVGYRAQVKGKVLNLTLGLSHPVDFPIPSDITIETPSQTTVVIKGINKQRVGQVAANIREYRKPEPYKGKGIRFKGEVIVLKETKKK